MNTSSSHTPRRADLLRITPAELYIHTAVRLVEQVGGHPHLTDAVVLLDQARNKVADFVDLHAPDTKLATDELEIIENKTIRKDLDYYITRVKALPASRERSIAITKLQEAVMWMGMDLKRINDANPGANPGKAENPYPNSKDPSNTLIDPTADGLKL